MTDDTTTRDTPTATDGRPDQSDEVDFHYAEVRRRKRYELAREALHEVDIDIDVASVVDIASAIVGYAIELDVAERAHDPQHGREVREAMRRMAAALVVWDHAGGPGTPWNT